MGHRIGDRKHVVEREMNVETGQISENIELENLDEEETDSFKKEWRERSGRAGISRRPHHSYNHHQLPSNRLYHPSSGGSHQPQLAIEHNSSIGSYRIDIIKNLQDKRIIHLHHHHFNLQKRTN